MVLVGTTEVVRLYLLKTSDEELGSNPTICGVFLSKDTQIFMLLIGVGSHAPASGTWCKFSSDTPMLLQTVCICDLTLTSRGTPFSTAADETGWGWRIQGFIMRGHFIFRDCQNMLTILISELSSTFFFLKNPSFLPAGIFTNGFSNASTEIQVLLGFISVFFKSLYIGLFVAPNMYWKAPFP